MSRKLASAAQLASTAPPSFSLVFQLDFDNFVIRKSGFNKTVRVLKRRLPSQLRRSRCLNANGRAGGVQSVPPPPLAVAIATSIDLAFK